MNLVTPVADWLPEGSQGNVRVERFEVNQEEAAWSNLRMMMAGHGHRAVSPGTYTRLVIDGRLWMSDTPAERRDHEPFARVAMGHCLIMGLGLGMAITAVARKNVVKSVTVIEINKDVIDLVYPHIPYREKIDVIHADALEWAPPKGVRYDAVWHDIWQSICDDNKPEIGKLKRRYGRKTHWQDAWGHNELKRMR